MNKENKKPLVSIITVCYNSEKYIGDTIESVLNQTYDNIEYIIVDGDSTDNTLDIIKEYEPEFKKGQFKWISEPDEGIYDAMNKGIDMANGDWINFMNSGDFFVDEKTINKISNAFESDLLVVYGNKIMNGDKNKPFNLNTIKYGVMFACHQSMFFNNRSEMKVYYSLNYRIYSDYELINRIYLNFGENVFKYVDINVVNYLGDGVSVNNRNMRRMEKYKIIYKTYGFKGIFRSLKYRFLTMRNKNEKN